MSGSSYIKTRDRTGSWSNNIGIEQDARKHLKNNLPISHKNENKNDFKLIAEVDSSSNLHNGRYVGDEHQISTQNELRRKSKELHEILKRKSGQHMSTKVLEPVLPESSSPQILDGQSHVTSECRRGKIEGSEKIGRNFKHVLLYPDHRFLSGNEISGVEICKKLFGITIFECNNGKAKWNPSAKDRKLVVQGVLEGSASHLSGRIHRGDMLIYINDAEVSWNNFLRLLNSLQKRQKVKLTFQSPKIVGPKSVYSILQVPEGDLCKAVIGKRLAETQSELLLHRCVALYLTLIQSSNQRELDEKEDIIYSFPPGEETLTAVRGLFITLSSALVDVVCQPATCTQLSMNDCQVNVVYKQCGRDVLVFAMPRNRISASGLQSLLEAFFSLMELLYSDVKSAFIDGDRLWMDKVLALMFHQALGLQPYLPLCTPVSHQLSSLETSLALQDYHLVKALHLSHENELICNEILNELESMDFDDYVEPKNLFARRHHVVLGTCLFYKDHLISSHLSPERQRSINLFLNCHGLLTLSSREDVSKVMVWQEFKSYSSLDWSDLPAGYRPSQANSFIMIIGQKHYYLVVVVEGSGGNQPNNGPLPLLVDQGRATLDQLETNDVHMSSCCEEKLNSPTQGILLATAEQFCSTTSPRSRTLARNGGQRPPLTPSKSAADNPFMLRSKSVDRLERESPSQYDLNGPVLMRRHGSKLSYGSNDSAGSSSSAGQQSKGKGSRVSSIADLSGIVRSQSVLHIDLPHDVLSGARLSRGKDNNLFNYVYLEEGEGILICPTEAELSEVHSNLQQEVIQNFCLSCQKIRPLFAQQVPKSGSSDTESSLFSTPTLVDRSYREAGLLFHCTFQASSDRKQVSSLGYWVIGRCWSSPSHQEMYVCCHESANQALVEMAFSLAFGT